MPVPCNGQGGGTLTLDAAAAAGAAAAQVAPVPGSSAAECPLYLPQAFFPLTLYLFLVQQSPSSGFDCGSKTPCCFCLKNGMGGEAKKGEFSKDPWTALETFTC